jgi:hypothetical protein
MLAWLGGKRKLLEAAKAKGANSSGFLPPHKQKPEERQGAAGRKHTSKRPHQHHILQHLQDAPCSQRQAATSKRLGVMRPSMSMDMLMCNGVHMAEECLSTEVAEPAADVSHAHAEPQFSHAEDAATAAVTGAGRSAINTLKDSHSTSSSHSTPTGFCTPSNKHPAAPAAQEPTLLAGSISPQAAIPPPPPAAPQPVALTASSMGHMPLNSDANKRQGTAAVRCTDWHALLTGGQSSFNNHKHTPSTAAAYDEPQQQEAKTGAYAVLQEQLVHPTANAEQHQNMQQPASFDLMFLQGRVPTK